MDPTDPLTCRAARRLMYENPAWEVGSPERERLEAHAFRCRDCAVAWQELRTLAGWVEQFPVPEPDDRYWQYRAAAITGRALRGPRRTPPFPRWLSWAAAAAGGALLLFTMGLRLGQGQVPPGPPPTVPAVQEKIVPVKVPVVVVRTERIVQTKVVTRWRERKRAAVPPRHSGEGRGQGSTPDRRGETSPSARAVGPAAQVESPLPQVERNEFREYMVRSLPEPLLVPPTEQRPGWDLDTVIDKAGPGEPAGTFVAPVRMVEVQAWPGR